MRRFRRRRRRSSILLATTLIAAAGTFLYFHKPAATKAASPAPVVVASPAAPVVTPASTQPAIAQQVIPAPKAKADGSPTIDDRYNALSDHLEFTKYTIQKGDSLGKIATAHNVTLDFLARLNHISDARKIRLGATLKVVDGPFNAIIHKHAYSMDILLAGKTVLTLPVGLGKDNSTPTGQWICEKGQKLKHPTYYPTDHSAVIEPGDPNNPLGNFWIGLAGTAGETIAKHSYGIHGTSDPASIGTQSSMGCIRLRDADITTVFELLVDGKSTVSVQD